MTAQRFMTPDREDALNKFENDDLPRILAALHAARESKCASTVKIEFAQNGGVIDVTADFKRKFK